METDARGACPRGTQRTQRTGQAGWVAAVVAAALLLAGCSPTFNWREVRPPGSAFRAMLPCKPDAAQRTVALAGRPVALDMLSCDTGGLTFAVASMQAPQGLATDELLAAWQSATEASLKVPAAQVQAWVPDVRLGPGSGAALTAWRAAGARADGSPVQAHVAWLYRGADVVQLAVYGPIAPAVMAQWLEGVATDATP